VVYGTANKQALQSPLALDLPVLLQTLWCNMGGQ
jgi:hypothetical protein